MSLMCIVFVPSTTNPSTKYIAKEQLAYRASGQHPAWGASSHWKAEESPEYVPYELDELGSKLYGDAPWEKVLMELSPLGRIMNCTS